MDGLDELKKRVFELEKFNKLLVDVIREHKLLGFNESYCLYEQAHWKNHEWWER